MRWGGGSPLGRIDGLEITESSQDPISRSFVLTLVLVVRFHLIIFLLLIVVLLAAMFAGIEIIVVVIYSISDLKRIPARFASACRRRNALG
jgi:hypothetical protein